MTMPNNKNTIIIADDHTLFRQGLTDPGRHGEYGGGPDVANGKELIEIQVNTTDLVIMDINMPL
jgi:DNA-binding NarL/FixJ family response regulator